MDNNSNPIFWTNDPKVLLSHPYDFIPLQKFTIYERLNSIVRFFFYLSLVMILIKWDFIYLYLFIGALLGTYLWNRYQSVIEESERFTQSMHTNDDKCVHSTINNPFKNALPFDDIGRAEACKDEDALEVSNIGDGAGAASAMNIPQQSGPIDDVWGRENAERQFNINPSTTIPNDREAFMKACWGQINVCKDGDFDVCANEQRGLAEGRHNGKS